VRIGPPPLYPAYPILPDRQEVYPRALGEVFVGNPRLDLPEVKAKVPQVREFWKAPEPGPEAALGSAKDLEQGSGASALESQRPGSPRPLVGAMFDLKA